MPDFDRDATKKALEWWENSLSLPGRAGREMAGDQLAEAARWAVQITEGDGELVRLRLDPTDDVETAERVWWCVSHNAEGIENHGGTSDECWRVVWATEEPEGVGYPYDLCRMVRRLLVDAPLPPYWSAARGSVPNRDGRTAADIIREGRDE